MLKIEARGIGSIVILVACTLVTACNFVGSDTSGSTSASSASASADSSPSTSSSASTASQLTSSAAWHTSTLVSANGDQGKLYYSPAGNAYLLYATLSDSEETTDLAYETNGTFGSPVDVFEGQPGSLYFKSSNDVLASVETLYYVNILENTNSGAGNFGSSGGWSYVTDYPSLGDYDCPFATVLSSVIASVNGTPTLFYGYWFPGPFGCLPVGGVATQSSGLWPSFEDITNAPATNVKSVLTYGTDVLQNGTEMSTNSGSTWTSVSGNGAFLRQSDGVLFLSSQSESAWSVSQSSNFGSSWTEIGSNDPAFTASITATSVAALGNTIVALAVVSSNQIYSMASHDGGATWTTPTKIVDISGGSDVISLVSMAASSAHIGLAYSEEDGSGDYEGVSFMEFY